MVTMMMVQTSELGSLCTFHVEAKCSVSQCVLNTLSTVDAQQLYSSIRLFASVHQVSQGLEMPIGTFTKWLVDSICSLFWELRFDSVRSKGRTNSGKERIIEWFFQQKTSVEPGSYYNCDLLPFFELGSVHYNFYLINIRIPVLSKMKVNHDIGKIDDIQFIVRTTFFPQRLRDWLPLALHFWLTWKMCLCDYEC